MAEFEQLGREYLQDLLGEIPNDLLPPTHPDGPRRMRDLDHAPWLDGMFAPDSAEERPGVCILRRSCGSSCYCVRGFVAEMRRRHGPHWPAEPPMPVGRVRMSRRVEEEQRQRQKWSAGAAMAAVENVRAGHTRYLNVDGGAVPGIPQEFLESAMRMRYGRWS